MGKKVTYVLEYSGSSTSTNSCVIRSHERIKDDMCIRTKWSEGEVEYRRIYRGMRVTRTQGKAREGGHTMGRILCSTTVFSRNSYISYWWGWNIESRKTNRDRRSYGVGNWERVKRGESDVLAWEYYVRFWWDASPASGQANRNKSDFSHPAPHFSLGPRYTHTNFWTRTFHCFLPSSFCFLFHKNAKGDRPSRSIAPSFSWSAFVFRHSLRFKYNLRLFNNSALLPRIRESHSHVSFVDLTWKISSRQEKLMNSKVG